VSVTSFLTDVSSEMIQHLVPLLLANVLGARTAVIGLVEGIAESTASLLKVFSGRISDRLGQRKWLAVGGYTISALAKPGFYYAASWLAVAGVRWVERTGKGVRTAPRDALLADSVRVSRRGFAFGLHRAADTAGAVLGLLIAALVVRTLQGGAIELAHATFRHMVLLSLIPAFLAVITLAIGAVDVASSSRKPRVRVAFRGLGRRFYVFLGIVTLFNLGNPSDAFLILRAQERGIGVVDLLWILLAFNVVYTVLSVPAGILSDRIGRKRVLAAGWLVFAVTFWGFAFAESATHVVILYLAYGAYYALVTGTGTALVADLVPEHLRGTAYGTYHAAVGLMNLPASVIAGLLWQGIGPWSGFGVAAPFLLGGLTALAATGLLGLLHRTD
jgi:MFS family permease